MKNIPPTPWTALSDSGNDPCIMDANGYHVLEVRDTALRIHIAQCANACAGMDDPVADVRELKLIASQSMGEYLGVQSLEEKCKQLEQALVDAVSAHQETLRGMADDLRKEFDSRREKFDAEIKAEPVRKSPYSTSFPFCEKNMETIIHFPDNQKTEKECREKFSGGIANMPVVPEHDTRDYLTPNKPRAVSPCPIKFTADKIEVRDSYGANIMDSLGYFNSTMSSVAVKSWHELGELPPVGTECEYEYTEDGEHWECKIEVINGNAIAFTRGDHKNRIFVTEKGNTKFRPLQTEKQKTIKEIMPILSNLYGSQNKEELAEACEKIYDKFIAKKAE